VCLHDFRNDWHGGVDGVADDGNDWFRGDLRALGQYLAQPVARVLTIPALMLKRSSRVIPGLRGIPAGMTTTEQPVRASLSPSPMYPVVLAGVLTCDKSAATPGLDFCTRGVYDIVESELRYEHV
jgi:hypothetical protein